MQDLQVIRRKLINIIRKHSGVWPETAANIADEFINSFQVFPKIDKTTWFYTNCERQRRKGAKICGCCPFRKGIENQE